MKSRAYFFLLASILFVASCSRPARLQNQQFRVRRTPGAILLQPNFHINAHLEQIKDTLAAAK